MGRRSSLFLYLDIDIYPLALVHTSYPSRCHQHCVRMMVIKIPAISCDNSDGEEKKRGGKAICLAIDFLREGYVEGWPVAGVGGAGFALGGRVVEIDSSQDQMLESS